MDHAKSFAKVHRLLRPGGLLASVDMVWSEVAEPDVVAKVHDETKKTFGIPMASRERRTWRDWKKTLQETGFTLVAEQQFEGNAWRTSRRDRRVALATALRHPLAFLQKLEYRRRSQPTRIPPGWTETWMAVWKRS
jgi:hypothetical protein